MNNIFESSKKVMRHFNLELRTDLMTGEEFLVKGPALETVARGSEIISYLCARFDDLKIPSRGLTANLKYIMRLNKPITYCPIVDGVINSLEWDGIQRVDLVLNAFETSNPYAKAMLKTWLYSIPSWPTQMKPFPFTEPYFIPVFLGVTDVFDILPFQHLPSLLFSRSKRLNDVKCESWRRGVKSLICEIINFDELVKKWNVWKLMQGIGPRYGKYGPIDRTNRYVKIASYFACTKDIYFLRNSLSYWQVITVPIISVKKQDFDEYFSLQFIAELKQLSQKEEFRSCVYSNIEENMEFNHRFKGVRPTEFGFR